MILIEFWLVFCGEECVSNEPRRKDEATIYAETIARLSGEPHSIQHYRMFVPSSQTCDSPACSDAREN